MMSIRFARLDPAQLEKLYEHARQHANGKELDMGRIWDLTLARIASWPPEQEADLGAALHWAVTQVVEVFAFGDHAVYLGDTKDGHVLRVDVSSLLNDARLVAVPK